MATTSERRPHTEPGDPGDLSNAVRALRELILAGEHFRHTVAAYLGIGISETACLSYLALDGPLTPRELASRIDLTPSAVTTLVDRLTSVGMIRRTPHRLDRRKTIVSLTDHGEECLALSRSWLRNTLVHVAPHDLELGARLFEQTAAAINDQSHAINAVHTHRRPAPHTSTTPTSATVSP